MVKSQNYKIWQIYNRNKEVTKFSWNRWISPLFFCAAFDLDLLVKSNVTIILIHVHGCLLVVRAFGMPIWPRQVAAYNFRLPMLRIYVKFNITTDSSHWASQWWWVCLESLSHIDRLADTATLHFDVKDSVLTGFPHFQTNIISRLFPDHELVFPDKPPPPPNICNGLVSLHPYNHHLHPLNWGFLLKCYIKYRFLCHLNSLYIYL